MVKNLCDSAEYNACGSATMEPERASVAELTNWLADLGEKHKEHLLQGEVKKNRPRSPVAVTRQNGVDHSTEYKTSACTAQSLPIASPPAPRRNTEGASQFPIALNRNQPVYREFTESKADGALSAEWCGPVDEQLRIVSLKKLLEPPLPSGQQRSATFVGWNASEDYSEDPTRWTKNKPGYVSTEECVQEHGQKTGKVSKQKMKNGPSRLLPLLMCRKHREQESQDPFLQGELSPRGISSEGVFKGPSDSNLDFKEWLESSSPEGSPLPIREFGFESLVAYDNIIQEDTESSSQCWNDDDESIVLPAPYSQDCNARMADIFDCEAAKAEPEQGSSSGNVRTDEFNKGLRIPRSPGSSTTKTESSSLSSKHSELKVFTPPRSDISSAIEKFGGRARSGRNPSVKSLQEQLQKKWSEDRAPCYSKKIKWHTSNGQYKKSVRLEYQK